MVPGTESEYSIMKIPLQSMKDIVEAITIEKLKEYLYQRSKVLAGFYAGMRRAYLLRACLLFLSGSWILPSFRYRGGQYIISSIRHLELIDPSNRSSLILIGGPLEFIYALRYRCGYINTVNLYLSITLNCFTPLGCSALMYYFSAQFSRQLSFIKRLHFLLIDSDGLPYKRALCLLTQAVGKKVVCLQHGIFPDPAPGIDGSLCDLNLVIDSKQISVFLDSGLSNESLALLSSVSRDYEKSVNMGAVKPKIILVGEGWVSHDFKRHQAYMKTLKRVKSDLSDLSCEVIYRPHPSERYSFWTYYNLLPVQLSKRSKNIFPWNIYIGTMSTLLVEAAKMGANAIQITDLFPLQENYDKYGVIQSSAADVRRNIDRLNLQGLIHNATLKQKLFFLNLEKISDAIPTLHS